MFAHVGGVPVEELLMLAPAAFPALVALVRRVRLRSASAPLR